MDFLSCCPRRRRENIRIFFLFISLLQYRLSKLAIYNNGIDPLPHPHASYPSCSKNPYCHPLPSSPSSTPLLSLPPAELSTLTAQMRSGRATLMIVMDKRRRRSQATHLDLASPISAKRRSSRIDFLFPHVPFRQNKLAISNSVTQGEITHMIRSFVANGTEGDRSLRRGKEKMSSVHKF